MRRDQVVNWPILLLILAILADVRRASAQSPRPRSDPSVPPVRTGGRPGAPWVAARRDVLHRVGVPDWAQDAVLAHWARETGLGRAEWNYNPGNIRAIGWRGPRVWLRGRDGTLDYRAYASIEEGARDYWRLLNTPRYRGALDLLRAGRPVDWYAAILRAGYSAQSDQALREFAALLRRITNVR